MKKGFTLVELSIGLVIIGGILVGQSLISSAQLTRTISDLKQYEIAVTQFKNKFRFHPGDSPHFTPAGNGDGYMGYGANGEDENCAAAPNSTLMNIEEYNFWEHLSDARMIKDTYVGPLCSGVNVGKAYPTIKVTTRVADEMSGNTSQGRSEIMAFSAGSFSQPNIALLIYTDPLDVPKIENKLGAKTCAMNGSDVGLCNPYGLGICASQDNDEDDAFGGAVSCGERAASVIDDLYGRLYLFFP